MRRSRLFPLCGQPNKPAVGFKVIVLDEGEAVHLIDLHDPVLVERVDGKQEVSQVGTRLGLQLAALCWDAGGLCFDEQVQERRLLLLQRVQLSRLGGLPTLHSSKDKFHIPW